MNVSTFKPLLTCAGGDCRDWEDLARAHKETTEAVVAVPQNVRLEQLKSLERMHEGFAQLMGRRFGQLQSVDPSVEAKIAFADRTHYGWYVVSAPSPWHWCYKCSMAGLGGDIVLDFGPNLVDGLVDDTQDRDQ
jgi:flagellar motor switch protein FliM